MWYVKENEIRIKFYKMKKLWYGFSCYENRNAMWNLYHEKIVFDFAIIYKERNSGNNERESGYIACYI